MFLITFSFFCVCLKQTNKQNKAINTISNAEHQLSPLAISHNQHSLRKNFMATGFIIESAAPTKPRSSGCETFRVSVHLNFYLNASCANYNVIT